MIILIQNGHISLHAKFITSQTFMQLFSNKKGGFTLVEMLIVIVIIGILAAALIPRLNTARGRANDTARKADLQQVSAVMVSYSIDHGVFPGTNQVAYSLEQLRPSLISAGISTIPLDPNRSREFDGLADASAGTCPGSPVTTAGQYGYIPIKKNGITYGGFVLMAGSETLGGSNAVQDAPALQPESDAYTSDGCIEADSIYSSIILCDQIEHAGVGSTDIDTKPCVAEKDLDVLRYIYIY